MKSAGPPEFAGSKKLTTVVARPTGVNIHSWLDGSNRLAEPNCTVSPDAAVALGLTPLVRLETSMRSRRVTLRH